MSLIQWNINGLQHNRSFLEVLIDDCNPLMICIQGTHLKETVLFSFKNFSVYRKDNQHRLRACGGVAILISNNYHSEIIQVNSELQAIVYKISYKIPLHIANIYLPPQENISEQSFRDLLKQLPRPCIIIGDMNANHHRWGSSNCNVRGRMIEKALEDSNLHILNTGEPTYFRPGYNTFSAIDVSACCSTTLSHLRWNVLPDLYNSDHYPILLCLDFEQHKPNRRPRWINKKANWELFGTYATLEYSHTMTAEDYCNYYRSCQGDNSYDEC